MFSSWKPSRKLCRISSALSILSAYSPTIHIIAARASGSSRESRFSHNVEIIVSYLLGYFRKISWRRIVVLVMKSVMLSIPRWIHSWINTKSVGEWLDEISKSSNFHQDKLFYNIEKSFKMKGFITYDGAPLTNRKFAIYTKHKMSWNRSPIIKQEVKHRTTTNALLRQLWFSILQSRY